MRKVTAVAATTLHVVVAVVAGGVAAALVDARVQPVHGEPATAGAVVVGLVLVVLLLLRRRLPLTLLVVVTAVQVASAAAVLALPVAAFTAAARSGKRRVVAVVALAAGAVLLVPGVDTGWALASRDLYTRENGVLVVGALLVAPAGLALYLRQRRELLAALTERAERAERERDLRAGQARVDERTRIAREMHDVVAHRMGLVVAHADDLRAAAHDGARTAATAELIRAVGHEALGELRSTLTVLRAEPGPGTDPALRPGARAPLPTIDEVDGLVRAARDAGLAVELRVAGAPVPVDLVIGRAVHAVVRSVLATAVGRASVVLDYADDRVTVRVGTDPAPSPDELLGPAERVRLVGGDLSTGRTSDGRSAVVATLPLSVPLPAAAR